MNEKEKDYLFGIVDLLTNSERGKDEITEILVDMLQFQEEVAVRLMNLSHKGEYNAAREMMIAALKEE